MCAENITFSNMLIPHRKIDINICSLCLLLFTFFGRMFFTVFTKTLKKHWKFVDDPRFYGIKMPVSDGGEGAPAEAYLPGRERGFGNKL